MNKLVYLGLSVLELGKVLMYEFWHDYVKPKYEEEEAKLCYTDTDIKQMIFTKIFQMLKQDLTLQIMN